MRRRLGFGTHLYGQIVYPLLVASIVVGVVATVVAVYFLEDLTGRWVSQLAAASANNVAGYYSHRADLLEREASAITGDDGLREALRSGDANAIRLALSRVRSPLDFAGLAVLDSSGRVVAFTGFSGMQVGTVPLGADGAARIGGSWAMFAEVEGIQTLCGLDSIASPSGVYTVLVSEAITAEALEDHGVGEDVAFALYDASGERFTVLTPTDVDADDLSDMMRQTTSDAPGIPSLLKKADSDDQVERSIDVGSVAYRLRAAPITFTNGGARPDAFVVSIASQRISEQTGITTRNLITMWSIVAIVALVGLGGWIARRVSDPLVELSVGASRIAEGDFTTRVSVHGASEVAELARSFNEMTASLSERTASLTKKVLELAAMYEMSRALGTTLDMNELLGTVLDSAMRIFDVETGTIALRDTDSGEVITRVSRGGESDTAEQAVRGTMSEWVVREARPLVFNPDNKSASSAFGGPGGRASLCVPLVSPEGPIGAILIASERPNARFSSDDVRLLSTIANHVTIAVGNIELFSSLQEAYLATVRSLASAVDAKDTYTRGHSDRVAMYCMLVADRLSLTHDQKLALEMASYLHDIGKIGISESILMKPGHLDELEMAEMRHHPLIGANILRPIAFPWPITPVVRHHHEAFDGSGYPAGLRGEEIPLLARVLTVADSFEAMTSDRPYRRGMTTEEAIAELRLCAGTQFDPRVVAAMADSLAQAGLERIDESVSAEDVSVEEARAVFSALVDGVFATFRRLGGPRLSANIEMETDERFADSGLPFRIARGRVTFSAARSADADGEIDLMRKAIREMDDVIAHTSGATLVDHFYADAAGSLSQRMQRLVRELRLRD